jgi:hypothetical protein
VLKKLSSHHLVIWDCNGFLLWLRRYIEQFLNSAALSHIRRCQEHSADKKLLVFFFVLANKKKAVKTHSLLNFIIYDNNLLSAFSDQS